MKVAIPSKKIPVVELRQPTVEDILSLDNVIGSINIKNAIVRRCCTQSIDNLTILDRDYLFFLCCSSVYESKVMFKVTCPKCNTETNIRCNLNEFEVFDLKEFKPKLKLGLNNKTYRFKFLSVKDEEWCIDKCYEWFGDYDESVIRDLENSLILDSISFSYKSFDKFFEKYKTLPINLLQLATDFHKIMFHGVLTTTDVRCQKCNHYWLVPIDFQGESILLGSVAAMDTYSTLSKFLSYSDFLKLTFSELHNLIDSLNAKLKK